jgi:hypothetical protein
MLRLTPRLTLLLLGGLLLGAADAPPADIVARRGDVQLTAADLKEALSHADPGVRAQLLANTAALTDFVRDRLLRQVLLNEARGAAWDQKPEVIARVNEARETVIMQTWLASRVQIDSNFPSPADIAAAYESNKARFAIPKQFHVAQLAILVPAGAPKEAEDEARRKAVELRQQATRPKADFAEIAKKSSQDRNSADRGGDLGWVREDQIVPAVRDAVRTMAENAISEPVRSAEAWHVIKLLGTRPPSFLPLDQVKESLVTALRQARTQQATKSYVEEMLRKEPAQINEVGLAARLAVPK